MKSNLFHIVVLVSGIEPRDRCRTLIKQITENTTMTIKPNIAKTMPVMRPGLHVERKRKNKLFGFIDILVSE